jgi:hypothetical protein
MPPIPSPPQAGDASLGSLEHWDETYKNSAGLYDWYHEWPIYRAEFLCQMAGTISGERLSNEGDKAPPVSHGDVAADAANDQDAVLALQKLDRESDILVVGCGNSSAHEFILAFSRVDLFVRFI